MLHRLSMATALPLLLAVSACSDGPTPPPSDRIAEALAQLGPAFTSGTERGNFAWYAIAALENGADLTQFTADVDGQARAFDGVALGIIYDDSVSAGGPYFRDSLVVLVGWRGAGAREMIAVAHLSDNYPVTPATEAAADLHAGPRVPRSIPGPGSLSRPGARSPTFQVNQQAVGDLQLSYLWYMVEASVWIDSLVRSAEANLTFGTQQCETRTLSTPTGYSFDTEGFPCRRGSFRNAIDVRVWPEVDQSGAPMATGRFNLVMRRADFALPNFLDLR